MEKNPNLMSERKAELLANIKLVLDNHLFAKDNTSLLQLIGRKPNDSVFSCSRLSEKSEKTLEGIYASFNKLSGGQLHYAIEACRIKDLIYRFYKKVKIIVGDKDKAFNWTLDFLVFSNNWQTLPNEDLIKIAQVLFSKKSDSMSYFMGVALFFGLEKEFNPYMDGDYKANYLSFIHNYVKPYFNSKEKSNTIDGNMAVDYAEENEDINLWPNWFGYCFFTSFLFVRYTACSLESFSSFMGEMPIFDSEISYWVKKEDKTSLSARDVWLMLVGVPFPQNPQKGIYAACSIQYEDGKFKYKDVKCIFKGIGSHAWVFQKNEAANSKYNYILVEYNTKGTSFEEFPCEVSNSVIRMYNKTGNLLLELIRKYPKNEQKLSYESQLYQFMENGVSNPSFFLEPFGFKLLPFGLNDVAISRNKISFEIVENQTGKSHNIVIAKEKFPNSEDLRFEGWVYVVEKIEDSQRYLWWCSASRGNVFCPITIPEEEKEKTTP